MCKSPTTLMDVLRAQASSLRKKGQVDSVIIDGMKIEYWRVGSGSKTVVFIHGNSSCKEVFYEQLNQLKDKTLSLISIDLPGHGNSDNAFIPDVNYTIPSYAKIVGKVMSKLSVESYSVIGWSLGGNIAIEMAGQGLPMNSMMIMGAPPIGPGIENVGKAFLPSSLEAPGKADLSHDEIIEFAQAIYGELDPIPELLFITAERTDGQAREIMLSHWMGGGQGHTQTDTVANWQFPIAVIHGKKEPFVALDNLEQTQWKNLWQDKIHVIDNAGHAPFIESATEFNTILMSFIKGI